MMKRFFLIIFLLSTSIWSQQQHQPQKWKKLKSVYANIIYKLGQKKEAQKIANTIAYVQRNNHKSMGFDYEPIDIILRANTVVPNGFVTTSPFRSEFFNTSPTVFNAIGTTDWMHTLAIHEYRHVQQFLNHKAGVTNVLYWLLGEKGWALGSSLAIPNWYFEGDAVVMETALTKSGRGRLPKFSALQRALYQNSIFYNYQKNRNGSYKDLIPNHYATGYQMLNYYRNHFDAAKLDDIAKKAARYDFPFYSFSTQMKRASGLTSKKLYQETQKANTLLWQQKRDSLQVKTYAQVTNPQKKVVQYHFPQLMENGNLIALKSSFDEIPKFFEIDTLGNSKKIIATIINIDRYFNYNQNKIVFTGFSYHPRYNYTSYNDLYIYDLASKERKKISHQKRYFSPAFNYNNSKIIAVENNQNNSKLVVLDSIGKEIHKIDLKGFITRPKFINDKAYVYIKQQDHQVAIFKIDHATLKETQITPFTSHSIDNINLHKNKVYFSASFNGIDNIYESSLNGSLKVAQVTNVHIGAYQPFVKNNTVYFTETVSNGNKISKTAINSIPFKFTEPVLMDFNNQKTVAFEGGSILDKIPEQKYITSSYNGFFKDLKFHDWNYAFSNTTITANITATNLLNDFEVSANTNIYTNENSSYDLSIKGALKKWFPVFNLALNYTHRDFDTQIIDIINNVYDANYIYDELSLSPSITIPLSQITGNYHHNFAINSGFEFSKQYNPRYRLKDFDTEIKNNEFNYRLFNVNLNASSKKRTALQNINSRLGFSINVLYQQALKGALNDYFLQTSSYLFLPGVLKTHNAFVKYAYRNSSIHNGTEYVSINSDDFTYTRGYKNRNTIKANLLSFNYQLPLLYPDFGVAGIVYFKRIRANLFADFSTIEYVKSNNINTLPTLVSQKQNAVGFEVIFDNTFFNIAGVEIGLGYRGSYLLEKDVLAPQNKFVSSFFVTTQLF